jgi:hypothetical protein
MQQKEEAFMSTALPFARSHSSAMRLPALPERAPAIRRAYGALRYRCPASGSYVLVTDPAALARLTGPQAPIHCPGCGDTHFLSLDEDAADIVRPKTAA